MLRSSSVCSPAYGTADIISGSFRTMRFDTTLTLALTTGLSLIPTATADWFGVNKVCLFTACSGRGDWHTTYGTTDILWKDGCQTRPGVPYMEWLCIDWKKARLSFKFEGQGQRCMRETVSELEDCGEWNTCSWIRYDETPCAWRLPAPEGVTGNSTTAEGTKSDSLEPAAADTAPAVQARAFVA